MSDDRTQPASPDVLGSGEATPTPRTFRGRPTMPGGIVQSSAVSSHTPPLPAAAFAQPSAIDVPPPPSFEELAGLSHERAPAPADDGPGPITLPSSSLRAAPPPPLPEDPSTLVVLPDDPSAVVVLPTISVGDDTPAPPLPLPPFDANPRFGPTATPVPSAAGLAASADGEPPPSSASRRQLAIAPNLPQIPKPVASKPMPHAPGIVSTQAIPLTVPAKRTQRSPLMVALLFVVVGAAIGLAGFFVLGSKTPAEASGSGPVAAEQPAGAGAAPLASDRPSAPALAPEPAASAAAAASSVAPTSAAPQGALTAAGPAAASSAAATSGRTPTASRPAGAPASTSARAKAKSDRIED